MSPSGEYIELSVPSNPKYLGILRHVVGQAADLLGFSEEDVEGVMLAVNEGCTNIIRHCYKMDEGQKIDILIRILPERMEVELRDYGEFQHVPEPEEPPCGEVRPGGLGLKLMNEIMDEVVYRPAEKEGTLLTMVKYRVGRQPS